MRFASSSPSTAPEYFHDPLTMRVSSRPPASATARMISGMPASSGWASAASMAAGASTKMPASAWSAGGTELVLDEAQRPGAAAEPARLSGQLVHVADERGCPSAPERSNSSNSGGSGCDTSASPRCTMTRLPVEDRGGGAKRLYEALRLLDLETADPKPFDPAADQAVHVVRGAGRDEHGHVLDAARVERGKAVRQERPVGDGKPVSGPHAGKGGELVVPRRRCQH